MDIDIKDIIELYKPDEDIFSEENEKIRRLKEIIYYDLDEVERRIILMYSELGTLEKLGKELGVSASSACLKLGLIRKKILRIYNGENID